MDTFALSLRVEKQLTEMEAKHTISSRWKMSDQEFTESEQALLLDKKDQLFLAIWKASKRRSFLLKLKAKYAGMY